MKNIGASIISDPLKKKVDLIDAFMTLLLKIEYPLYQNDMTQRLKKEVKILLATKPK